MYLIQENFDLKQKIIELESKIQKLEDFRSEVSKISRDIDGIWGDVIKDLEREFFGFTEVSCDTVNELALNLLTFLEQNYSDVNFIRTGNCLEINISNNYSILDTYDFWRITTHHGNSFICVQDDCQQEFHNIDIVKSWAINSVDYLIAQKRI